jgi:pre-mRNA-splicing factor SYF1
MHFILPEYLMQKEQGKVSEEAVDGGKHAEDDMAALERQLAPAGAPMTIQAGTRALGFVSAGVEIQGSSVQVKNPDEIELGEEDEEGEEDGENENIEVAQKKVPDAVYGDLAEAAKKLLQNDEGGKQRSRESNEPPMGALERFKRQRQQ